MYTERRADLTPARERNFARLRARLEAAGARSVGVSHYEEVDASRLARAEAVVLSGSTAPWEARDPAELDRLGEALRACGRPALGVCAGMQLLARFAGGTVARARRPERGFLPIEVRDASDLLRGLPRRAVVFQEHPDEVAVLPEGFRLLASSAACAVQAFADPGRRWWGTQFHPEESTPEHPAGEAVLRSFLALAADAG